ncbi:MAG: hypothetical protein KAG10_10335 [Methylococcales bacterium]|nr:hypothetical protein [Methylococcales bacterium]MCK5926281.1 hypothetical protein [Methylococcales bacterium]
MNDPLDSDVSYLYGILFDRTAKQVLMEKKQLTGTLGVWGRSRLSKRAKDIEKIIFHIFEKKNTDYQQIISEILIDLDYIEANNDTWGNVSLDELIYLRNLLNELS